ncbi:PLCXD2 [Symbiodinium sp. CCMP2592]|nr:PLCXD2 [Symbiodinium sp. CCMP2592]
MGPTKPNPRTVLFLKEYVEERMVAICKENNIGPKKLARCLKRGIVPINFSFVDLGAQSRGITEALCDLAVDYGIVSKKMPKPIGPIPKDACIGPGHQKMLMLKEIVRRGQASPKSSSLAADSYALDTDETQVVQGSLACEQREMVLWPGFAFNFSGPTDDDDVILVEPHRNPLQEIEISEDEEDTQASGAMAMTDTQEIVVAAELPGSTASKVSNTIPGKIIFKKKEEAQEMSQNEEDEQAWWLKQTPKTSVPEVSAASPVSKTAAEKTKKPKTPIKSPDPEASPVAKTSAKKRKKQKTPIKSPDPEAVRRGSPDVFSQPIFPQEGEEIEIDASPENYKDDGRLPLTAIPWPVWSTTADALQAEADRLIHDLEAKTGPLDANLLQAQRKLRKDAREGNDGTGEEEEEKEAKPTKSKPKAKSKAKAKAKSKAVPEVKESKEDVLSEAEELDREEYAIKNQLRQEDDEDAQQGKQTAANKKKGKKKKKKQAAAAAEHDAPVCGKEDDAAEEVPLKGVKRRLDFEACLEPSVSNGMEEASGASAAVGRAKKKLKRKIRKKGLRKAEQDVARTPAKEKEKHEEAADDERKADEAKKKAKKFDDTNPMSKSRQQLEAKKDSIIKDLQQLRVLDNAMVLPTDFKDIASFTINPSPKVKEQEGAAGSTSIGVLSGCFYVKPVPKARLEAINLHSPAEHKLKANNSDGVNVSWNKGNLGDLQDWKQATEEDPGVSAEVLQDNIEQNSEIIHKKLDSGPRLLLQQGKASEAKPAAVKKEMKTPARACKVEHKSPAPGLKDAAAPAAEEEEQEQKCEPSKAGQDTAEAAEQNTAKSRKAYRSFGSNLDTHDRPQQEAKSTKARRSFEPNHDTQDRPQQEAKSKKVRNQDQYTEFNPPQYWKAPPQPHTEVAFEGRDEPRGAIAEAEQEQHSSSTWSDASWARPWTREDWWSSGWDDQWSSWSWGRDDSSWSSWPSSGDDDKWKKPRCTDDDAAVPKDESAKSAADRVQALLQRGHTIDQLSTEDLKQIVQQIDKSKQGAADGQAEKPKTGDAENKEQGEGKEEKEGKRKDETKEERRKRLHARNMRYYRSFESAMCPREISKLSKKASDDAGMRSYLFESWLSSGENWHKSSLLSRLRSKKSATARGFRKWMLRKEMVEKWGEEMADDMIEAKMTCEEKRMTEIRNWPECPKREVKQYLCLFEDSAEDVDHTELEMELSPEEEQAQEVKANASKAY